MKKLRFLFICYLSLSMALGSLENLTLHSTEADGAQLSGISGGVAHISSTADNYLISEFSLAEGSTAGVDLQGLTQITLFLQFSADGTGTNWCDIVHLDNLARVFTAGQKPDTNTYDMRLRYGENCNSSNRMDTGNLGESFFEETGDGEGDVVCLAVSLNFDTDAKTVTAVTYTSYDNGETYTQKTKGWSEIDSLYTVCNRLVLGKLFDARGQDRGFSFDIHDFRIFNLVLNEAELQSLTGVTPGPDDGEETNTPESSVQEPEQTKVPAGSDTAAPGPEETKAPDDATSGSGEKKQGGCQSASGPSAALALAAGAALCTVSSTRKKRFGADRREHST